MAFSIWAVSTFAFAFDLQFGGVPSRGRCGSRPARVRRRRGRVRSPPGWQSRPRAAPERGQSQAARARAGAPASRLQRLLAGDLGRLDIALAAISACLGVRPRPRRARPSSRTVATTRASSLSSTTRACVDVVDLAGLLAGDALLFQRQFGGDALLLDRLAAGDLGSFELAILLDLRARTSCSAAMRSASSARFCAMRACSTASSAATRASSMAWLRQSHGCWSAVGIDTVAAICFSRAMRADSTASLAAIFSAFHGLLALDLQLADPLVLGDPGLVDLGLLQDAQRSMASRAAISASSSAC
jgi:hypothetical protein